METITIPATDGSGQFEALVVAPRSQPAGAVVLIQEIFGVNATMRALSHWVAEMGFLALCPDLFWRQEPGVQLDPDAGQAQWDRAFALFRGFDQEKGVEDLAATIAAARAHPACNGKVGTMGFCLGGRMAYRTAVATDADCHVSYYGVGIEGMLEDAPRIRAPLLMHIAERDKFVPPEAQAAILAALKDHPKVTCHVYPGVDHAFARMGGHAWDARAATIANGRTAEFLVRHLG
ncbi:dienelactone hydrolase family protein [Rubritepida flocculans]|uniref:dienelactone hydrolase family protein n=1 Tax=Rubritepida flocculans TaxID=182403 RepID=UPI0003FE0053|nr:dienelactone hydrolase family protein [Rubritepida flocculans]